MKKYFIGILLLMIGLALTACSANHTNQIANQLQPTELIKVYNTIPPNLAKRSKCSSPPSIKIINAEKNEGDHNFYTKGGQLYITPKELVDSIVIYMSDAFNRTGIKTDNNSTNIIEVSIEKLKVWNKMWVYNSNTQLKIVIPEIKYTKIYDHSDTTTNLYVTVAYDIHEITWKIINDPVIQDYLLCTNKAELGNNQAKKRLKQHPEKG